MSLVRRVLLHSTLPVLALSLAARAVPPPAAAGSFTLRQVMSAPFPSELAAASRADTVAWMMNLSGVRNVWAASGPAFHARPLTHYSSDNGISLYDLQITPDGKTVVYVLGNERNRQGAIANPASSVITPAQQVWAVNIADGEPRLLGKMDCGSEGCEDIKLSPDGRFAVWPARHELWLAPLSGAQPARRLCYVRGDNVSPHWSPGGHRIAFVSLRGDHSFIAVYDFARHRLRYIAPSVDRDYMPRWSPRGRRLAFLRTAGARLAHAIIPVHPRPFAIWIANPRTGRAHPVWRSGPRPQDSLPWQTESECFAFAAGNRIAFSSWQDGHLHLYSVSVAGGVARLLTPGAFDIWGASFSPHCRAILYASNQNGLERRHLWQVSVAGGPPQPLTSGTGVEWTPVETGGRHIFYIGAGPRRPALPMQLAARPHPLGARVLPADFPRNMLVVPRAVTFPSADGLLIHAQLFTPRAHAASGPALVYIHGGSMRQMMLGWNPMRYYYYAYAENQYLASLGFTVLSVNYRSGIMYGYAFRHPANYGWRGASEYQDILAAGLYLRRLAYVNPREIGLWGGSWGGYLTALGLAKNSDLFAAGVDMHGVHDWAALLGGRGHITDLAAAKKLAFQSSPDAYVSTWRSPVLLIQGDDDRNVPFSQMVDLVQRLRAHHVPFEQLVFPDEVHMFLRWQTWLRAYAATAVFFERTLVRHQPLPPNP